MPRRDDERDDDLDDVRRRPREKKKQSGPWLWIGLGCGCLSLLGTVGLGAAIVIGFSLWPGGGGAPPGPPAPPGVPPNPIITQMAGLIAYWSFDEVKGNSVIDHSGNERGWIINNDNRWGHPSFQGGIDEVCVFNRAIEPAEIQTLLEAGR